MQSRVDVLKLFERSERGLHRFGLFAVSLECGDELSSLRDGVAERCFDSFRLFNHVASTVVSGVFRCGLFSVGIGAG